MNRMGRRRIKGANSSSALVPARRNDRAGGTKKMRREKMLT